MFEINIFDSLSSLSVGAMILCSIIYLVYSGFKLFNSRKHNTGVFLDYLLSLLKEELKQTGYTILVLVFIFSIGILTQDITDHLSDSDVSKNEVVNYLKGVQILEKESVLRRCALVRDYNKLTGLGVEIFGNEQIFGEAPDKIPPLLSVDDPKSSWKERGSTILNDRLTSFDGYVNRVYYKSKNWCYMNSDAVRNELMDIQTRIDLSRSVTLVSLFTLVAIAILYLIYFVKEGFKRQDRYMVVIVIDGMERTVRKVFNPILPICILLTVFLCARLCYEVAEGNFNERAFGYFSSHMISQK